MQDHQILPEVYTVRPDSKLETVVHNAIKTGIKLIVVAGGDGTIDSVMGAMVGSDATLGIIPTGTRNNVAFNLGITGDIASSVALLRQGRRLKIDVGRVHCGHSRHWFLEAAALGLLSDLYPMADDFQHGDLAQIGGLLSTLVSSTPSRLRINLDGHKHLTMTAHMLLIANMPFLGPHFQISPKVSFKDGHLDVFTFSDMSKLNMLSYAMLSQRWPGGGCRYQALPRQTRKDCFKSANARTCRWSTAGRRFIICSYPSTCPDSYGRISAYRTAGNV